MSKNSIIATAIIILVLLVPFRFAFLEIDIKNPMLTMICFLSTMGGVFLSLFFALRSDK